MIKEKYISIIAILATIISITIGAFSIFISTNNTYYKTPEYLSKVFDPNKVMQIDIQIDDGAFNKLLENATKEEFVPCDVVINDAKLPTVGIRAKGNSSLSMVASNDETDRFSFKIDFAHYISDQNLYGLDEIALNNIIGDATYMKEYLSYDMMQSMGINTPAHAFANITINNKPWGLYLAVEPLETNFLERYYGTNYGNLYKPESSGIGDMPNDIGNMPNSPDGNDAHKIPSMNKLPGTDLVYIDDDISSYPGIFNYVITKNTTDYDMQNVITMMKNLNQGTNLEKYLDTDEILKYFAVNTFIVNLDSYASDMKHNYYLYENGGKFQILPWDFNLAFGGFGLKDSSKVINFPIDNPLTCSPESSPLISKLLEVDEYKNLYHKYLNDILTDYIYSGKFENKITKIDSLISDYVQNDATSFYTFDEYKLAILNLKKFGMDRALSISKQLSGDMPSTTYGNVETTMDLSALGSMGMGKDETNHQMPPNEQMGPGNKPSPPPQMITPKFNIYDYKKQIIMTVKCIISIIIGLLFASKFKRRKYNYK